MRTYLFIVSMSHRSAAYRMTADISNYVFDDVKSKVMLLGNNEEPGNVILLPLNTQLPDVSKWLASYAPRVYAKVVYINITDMFPGGESNLAFVKIWNGIDEIVSSIRAMLLYPSNPSSTLTVELLTEQKMLETVTESDVKLNHFIIFTVRGTVVRGGT